MGERDGHDAGATFPIVGVGASAGGLEAFTQLLKALPVDTGMAFVLVQHLAPSHPSALAEILSRATSMPVLEVRDEPVVKPNHVYVIPPGRCMIIARGTLALEPREGEGQGQRRVIDHFLRALAEDSRHRAIGVILSGTASDGTLGMEAIKAEGGITFAQDASAQHDGMPTSAIDSGCVDFVLAADAIARELVRISQHPYTAPAHTPPNPEDVPDLAQIVQVLHHATGVDFAHYKFNTFYRRVARRMLLHKLDKMADYAELLRHDAAETDALRRDILISVTSFFRNPEAWDALGHEVFPRLLKDRSHHDTVRFWSLGCSTGQEAYSLAIAFIEFCEAARTPVLLQLFATDLNDAAIDKARAGVYPKDIAQDVSPERLRRFFTEVDGGYRIVKSIRDLCVFSRHNALTDPPFSRIDLLSCRNLLIYLEPVLQQKIMPMFHYAIKPTGFLWLGSSETIGNHRQLFEAQDTRHKIYSKKGDAYLRPDYFPLQHDPAPNAAGAVAAPRRASADDLPKEVDRILSTRFAPPSVLVSADLEILQYRGDTSAYLAPGPGKASLGLLKMLREGLLVAVRAAIARASKDRTTVYEDGLRVKSDNGNRDVGIEVIPLNTMAGAAKHGGFLILFHEAGAKTRPPMPAPKPVAADAAGAASDSARLTQELAATREYLQSVIEQQEAAYEELQSANEEVQSANEELQSTNEELETSKEEIQSSNEELVTLNDELNNRNNELSRLNNDLTNLLGSVQMPIVMLGPDLRVRRFTPAAEKLLNLTAADVGHVLTEFKLTLDDLSDVQPLLMQVIDTAHAQEHAARDAQGRRYSLRLHPYRTPDRKIDGVVLVLVDVDALERAHALADSILSTASEPLLVLDQDLRVRNANPAFYKTFGVAAQATLGRPLYELSDAQWDIPELRRLLLEILPRDQRIDNLRLKHNFAGIGLRTMTLNARTLLQNGDQPPLILLAIQDVTESDAAAESLRHYAAELSEGDRRKNEFLAMLGHELRNPLAPIRNAIRIMQLADGDKAAAQTALRTLDRQAGLMVRLVEDLLDAGRITRGKIGLRRAHVELRALIAIAVEDFRGAYARLNREFEVMLPSRPVYVEADASRLIQVVSNLLSNARKFTDDGGRITLSLEKTGKQAVIRVRDDGIGIAADQIPRIFVLFAQIDTSMERSAGGLGIGLALAKNLVEMHGGTIQARSDGLGHGCEFSVHLPTVAASAKPTAPAKTVQTMSGQRILVVDDNLDSAESMAMLLELTGNQTRTAHDGIDAVKQAAAFRPGIVLMDIGLPRLNGYEAARRIRAKPWGKKMVLVAITGWGQDEDRQQSTDAGFDGHLVKPMDYAALTQLLASLPAR